MSINNFILQTCTETIKSLSILIICSLFWFLLFKIARIFLTDRLIFKHCSKKVTETSVFKPHVVATRVINLLNNILQIIYFCYFYRLSIQDIAENPEILPNGVKKYSSFFQAFTLSSEIHQDHQVQLHEKIYLALILGGYELIDILNILTDPAQKDAYVILFHHVTTVMLIIYMLAGLNLPFLATASGFHFLALYCSYFSVTNLLLNLRWISMLFGSDFWKNICSNLFAVQFILIRNVGGIYLFWRFIESGLIKNFPLLVRWTIPCATVLNLVFLSQILQAVIGRSSRQSSRR